MDERLGRYRLGNLLATGGMGEVFLARQEGPAGFSKQVVVKRILRHLASDETFVEMFLNEARVAAQLSHPNIVQIFELGHEDGTYFLAMEYVQGRSVRSVCARLAELKAAWPPELAAWIGAQALQGLQHAHALRDEGGNLVGVVHRDVSPENLLLSNEGNVKVVDFGLAKAANLAVTKAGRLKGKLAYVAPEQLKGERVDGRTDLYAMAVTLYELLTGELPYARPLQASDGEVVLKEVSVPPRQRNTRVPRELEEIVLKALAKEPSSRFPSAAVMASELDGFIRRSGLEASAPKVAEILAQLSPATGTVHATAPLREGTALHTIVDRSRILAPSRRRRRWVWAVPPVALAVLAGVGVVWLRRAPAPVAPPPEEMIVESPIVEDLSAPEPTAEGTEATTPGTPVAPAEGEGPEPPPRAHPKRPALGRVRVRVNPWAEVLLDGQKLGTTPMPPAEVSAGAHVLTLQNKALGVERRIRVRVRPGVETLVKADLLEATPTP